MRSMLVLMALVTTTCAQVPEGFREFTLPTLKLKGGTRILISSGEPTSGPGHLRIIRGRTERRMQWGFQAGRDLFAPPANADQAMERASWGSWGAVVPDAKTFDKICALYRKEGFTLKREPGRYPEAWLSDVDKRRFDIVKKRTDKGWEVAFTAFILRPGMGASASVVRLRYSVDRAGRPTATKGVEYLTGPALNWQLAEFGGGEQTEAARKERERIRQRDRERRAQRDRIVRGIYALGLKKLPLGR